MIGFQKNFLCSPFVVLPSFLSSDQKIDRSKMCGRKLVALSSILCVYKFLKETVSRQNLSKKLLSNYFDCTLDNSNVLSKFVFGKGILSFDFQTGAFVFDISTE